MHRRKAKSIATRLISSVGNKNIELENNSVKWILPWFRVIDRSVDDFALDRFNKSDHVYVYRYILLILLIENNKLFVPL